MFFKKTVNYKNKNMKNTSSISSNYYDYTIHNQRSNFCGIIGNRLCMINKFPILNQQKNQNNNHYYANRNTHLQKNSHFSVINEAPIAYLDDYQLIFNKII